MYYTFRILRVGAVIALGVAMWFSVRLAVADASFRNGTPESVDRAIALMPSNADYRSFRALQLEYDGQDSEAELRRAAALNPLSSAPRLRLGLASELRGDSNAAEHWLLDAARVDHEFEPRWTLANFYFRRAYGNPSASDPEAKDQFWNWINSSLAMSYDDRRPAFDLCWRASPDPNEILSRAIPGVPEVERAYLSYLLEEQHLDALAPVAMKLATLRDPADRPILYAACDALIAKASDEAQRRNGQSSFESDASAAWRALTGSLPLGVTNGNFTAPPANHGFDWRVPEVSGVTHANLDAPPAHRIILSGDQPASSELLRQWMELIAGRRYTLRWQSRSSSLSAPSGIEWRMAGTRAPVASSSDWQSGEATLVAPTAVDSLALWFERPLGQARAQGMIELRDVSITESK